MEPQANHPFAQESSIKPLSDGSLCILVDAHDAEKFAIRIRAAATDWEAKKNAIEHARTFPQGRWNEREGAFLIPVTDPNLQHLFRGWQAPALRLTDAAQLLINYHVTTRKVADVHAKERLDYLEHGKVSALPADYVHTVAYPPMDHQKVAFCSGRKAEFFAFLMEMGTGKTKVMIDVLCDRVRVLRKKNPVGQLRVLIVAPKTVTHNWVRQFELHSTVDSNVTVLRGGKLKRVGAMLETFRDKESALLAVVVNYESVQRLEDAFKMVEFDVMVLDESTRIKSPDAKRSRAAKRVGETAKARFILTGQPITKNVLDLWNQFEFLQPGLLGYTTYGSYKSHYAITNHWGGIDGWRKDKLPELQERLTRFSFIIKRAQCLTLPDKTYQTLEVEMEDDQLLAYKQMANDLLVSFEQPGIGLGGNPEGKLADEIEQAMENEDEFKATLEGIIKDTNSPSNFAAARIILTQMLRLAQITSGHIKKDDGALHYFKKNPKLDALLEMIDDLDDLDKMVIWSRFVPDIDLVNAALIKKFGPPAIASFYQNGKLNNKAEFRMSQVSRFQDDPNTRFFVGNPSSGGIGIDLFAGNHCVYIANDFSLENRTQSEDRLMRMGQKRNVLYTDIIVTNTIDEVVLGALKSKRDLANLLVDKNEVMRSLRTQLAALGNAEAEDEDKS